MNNVHLVLGMKNAFELEGVIDTQNSSFKISEQVNTILFKRTSSIVLKPKERKFIKIEGPL